MLVRSLKKSSHHPVLYFILCPLFFSLYDEIMLYQKTGKITVIPGEKNKSPLKHLKPKARQKVVGWAKRSVPTIIYNTLVGTSLTLLCPPYAYHLFASFSFWWHYKLFL